MKNFDENKALRSLSKVARINSRDKWIEISKGQIIGLRRLAQIDYLIHYCGYRMSYGGRVAVGDKFDIETATNAKYQKKDKKSYKLTDKRKK